jgi:exosortase H (IPTLxxWG-CTERM-specific)
VKKSFTKSTLTKWYNDHPVFVFIGLFALQIVVFYPIYLNPWMQDKVFTHLVTVYAELSSKLLHLIGHQTLVTGDFIYSKQFSVAIKKGCDAVEPMALFMAGIIAFPVSVRKKLPGILVGLMIIFFLNIVRIVVLFLTGIYAQSLFETMHVEVWQMIFILVAIAIWLLWLRWAVRKSRK